MGLPYQYLNDALVHVHESVANAASNQRQGHAELEPSELSASSIYVASLDMPRFVNEIWPRIPKTHRVVLVTAQEVPERMHSCDTFLMGRKLYPG